VGRWRRVARALALGFGAAALLILSAMLAVAVWLRSDSGRARVRGAIERRASQAVHGTVRIGAVESLLPRLVLAGVEVRDAAGARVARVATVEVAFRPWAALFGRQRIGVVLSRPEVWWAERAGPAGRRAPSRLEVDRVQVRDGRVEWRPGRGDTVWVASQVAAEGQVLGERVRIDLRSFALAAVRPRAGASAAPLRGHGRIEGTRRDLEVDLELEQGAGRIVVAGAVAPERRAGRATVDLAGVAPSALLRWAPASLRLGGHLAIAVDLSAGRRVALSGEGLTGALGGIPFHDGKVELRVDGPRLTFTSFAAAIPGAEVRGAGSGRTDGAMAIDFVLRVTDPAALPVLPEVREPLGRLGRRLAAGRTLRGTVYKTARGPVVLHIGTGVPLGIGDVGGTLR
jgi:hypothetical protein